MSLFPRIRPRAILHSLLTYPRFLGTIKPELVPHAAAEMNVRLRALSRSWWPRKLDVLGGKRILVIAPHPDDESIGPGGFLLRHREQSEIHFLVVLNGEGGGRLESGPWVDTREYKAEIVSQRKGELAKVSERLRVRSTTFLEHPDGKLKPSPEAAARLRAAVDAVHPDIVLLPWFLDRHSDHRAVNVLYAWGCAELDCMVLGFEVWEMLPANAILDITDVLEEKLELIRCHRSQVATVDYASMCRGLAAVRAFHNPVRDDRSGAVEAFLALPNREYCELVCAAYGPAGQLTEEGQLLLV